MQIIFFTFFSLVRSGIYVSVVQIALIQGLFERRFILFEILYFRKHSSITEDDDNIEY